MGKLSCEISTILKEEILKITQNFVMFLRKLKKFLQKMPKCCIINTVAFIRAVRVPKPETMTRFFGYVICQVVKRRVEF